MFVHSDTFYPHLTRENVKYLQEHLGTSPNRHSFSKVLLLITVPFPLIIQRTLLIRSCPRPLSRNYPPIPNLHTRHAHVHIHMGPRRRRQTASAHNRNEAVCGLG